MFTQAQNISNKSFKIINLKSNISLVNVDNQNDYSFSPDQDPDYLSFPLIVMAKGSVNLPITRLEWQILDPLTNLVSDFSNPNFSNFSVELLDVDNNVIKILNDNLNYCYYDLSSDILAYLSSSIYNDVNYLRNVRIRIKSYSNDNKISEAVFVLDFPVSSFSDVSSTISNGIFISNSGLIIALIYFIPLLKYFKSVVFKLYTS